MNDLTPYFVAAITGLSAAIGVLWRSIHKHSEITERRLSDCEEDREDLWEVVRHVAVSHAAGDKIFAKKAAEIATQKLEKKRTKPPSDLPADETIKHD